MDANESISTLKLGNIHANIFDDNLEKSKHISGDLEIFSNNTLLNNTQGNQGNLSNNEKTFSCE